MKTLTSFILSLLAVCTFALPSDQPVRLPPSVPPSHDVRLSTGSPIPRAGPPIGFDYDCYAHDFYDYPDLTKPDSIADCQALLRDHFPKDENPSVSHRFGEDRAESTLYKLPVKICHRSCCVSFGMQHRGSVSLSRWSSAKHWFIITWKACQQKKDGYYFGGNYWFGTQLNIEASVRGRHPPQGGWPGPVTAPGTQRTFAAGPWQTNGTSSTQ